MSMQRWWPTALFILAVSFGDNGCLRAAEAQSFDSKGVKIRYFVEGSGPPVILIHGLNSNANINWEIPGATALLAKDFQVIAPDMRGHGGSDKPKGDGDYGMEMVEDIVRLLDHLKIKKAHIVGYSMGGMITLKLAVTHADRVLSATIGGMGWMREGGLGQKMWEKTKETEGSKTPSACPRSFGKLAIGEADLRAIKIPVAVLIGDRDPVKKVFVTPLQGIRKDWPVTEITDAGHLTCVGKPQFLGELRQWLKKQPQP